MDARRAARVSDVVVRRITSPAVFWQATARAGERLVARGLIDYAHRRALFSGLEEVPHPVLFALYRPLGLPVTARRRRMGSGKRARLATYEPSFPSPRGNYTREKTLSVSLG
ncbi:hypothetical protein ACH4UT_33160 [Streptomyces sp. NPDC020799]|uniref:hypothetical protein n=1 Tax=Streptomyces sp. NPDC020799 TaxID=3365091 RepID=UPI0037A0F20B